MYRWGYPIAETDPGTLEDCCHKFHLKYKRTDVWDNGIRGDDREGLNVMACMSYTEWTGPDNSSHVWDEKQPPRPWRNASSHRMLLSSSSSSSYADLSYANRGRHGPRCYKVQTSSVLCVSVCPFDGPHQHFMYCIFFYYSNSTPATSTDRRRPTFRWRRRCTGCPTAFFACSPWSCSLSCTPWVSNSSVARAGRRFTRTILWWFK